MTKQRLLLLTVGERKNPLTETVESPVRFAFLSVPRFTQIVEAVNHTKHGGAQWLAAELCLNDLRIRKMLEEIKEPGLSSVGEQVQASKPSPYATFPASAPKLWIEFSWESVYVFDPPAWCLGQDDGDAFLTR